MNYTTVKEISELRIESAFGSKIRVQWSKVEYECEDKVEPLMAHTTLPYKEKLYMFGGT
jgi:hypothetical protein